MKAIRKEIPATKRPIIALTAKAMANDREYFIAEGMDDYIAKPINKKIFETILQEYLS